MSTDPLHGREIVVGVAGGIAVYKVAALVSSLRQRGAGVTVVMTANAARFVQPLTFATLTARPVVTDLFERPESYEAEHVALAQRAQLAIVAPATADLLGKLAAGIADGPLTTTLISLECPVLLAPAMNHRMWAHPIVQANVQRLEQFGYRFVGPEEGWLACGETGPGRLASSDSILDAAEAILRDG